LFATLDKLQRKLLVDAMERNTIHMGETVIRQGQDGDYFYVIESGEFDVYKDHFDCLPPEKVKHLVPGNSFGELALMYNDKRAASVVATTPATVWALDRATFRYYVVTGHMKNESEPAASVENNSNYCKCYQGDVRNAKHSQPRCEATISVRDLRVANKLSRRQPDKSDWRNRRNAQLQRRYEQNNSCGRRRNNNQPPTKELTRQSNIASFQDLHSTQVGSSDSVNNRRKTNQNMAPPRYEPHSGQTKNVVSSTLTNAISRGSHASKTKMKHLQFPLEPQDWKILYRHIRSRDAKKSGTVNKNTVLDVMKSAGLGVEGSLVGNQLIAHTDSSGSVDYHSFIKACLYQE
jgi:hypothetical protein